MSRRRLSLALNTLLVAHVAAIGLSIAGPLPILKSSAKKYVDPLFTQDWQLFAPEPINADTTVTLRCRDGYEEPLPGDVRHPNFVSSLDQRALWRTTISKS